MKIKDFAELQKFYTGANNKRKWVIVNKTLLLNYFKKCQYKPAILKYKLKTSYATTKRLLCSANLWYLAKIKKQNYKSGRKRTITVDKFGYKLAHSKYDYVNTRGEITRRYEHHIVAEKAYKRKLKNKEVVHHINLNKLDNSSKNLHICKDNSEHRKLHIQLEHVAGKLVEQGIIKFCKKRGYYV